MEEITYYDFLVQNLILKIRGFQELKIRLI